MASLYAYKAYLDKCMYGFTGVQGVALLMGAAVLLRNYQCKSLKQFIVCVKPKWILLIVVTRKVLITIATKVCTFLSQYIGKLIKLQEVMLVM